MPTQDIAGTILYFPKSPDSYLPGNKEADVAYRVLDYRGPEKPMMLQNQRGHIFLMKELELLHRSPELFPHWEGVWVLSEPTIARRLLLSTGVKAPVQLERFKIQTSFFKVHFTLKTVFRGYFKDQIPNEELHSSSGEVFGKSIEVPIEAMAAAYQQYLLLHSFG